MNQYNIDKFSKEDIFSGRLITPMRQWLHSHNIETKNYDYYADMAIVTHYLQNKDYPEGQLYREEAIPLIERYYRASHPGSICLANYIEMSFVDITKRQQRTTF